MKTLEENLIKHAVFWDTTTCSHADCWLPQSYTILVYNTENLFLMQHSVAISLEEITYIRGTNASFHRESSLKSYTMATRGHQKKICQEHVDLPVSTTVLSTATLQTHLHSSYMAHATDAQINLLTAKHKLRAKAQKQRQSLTKFAHYAKLSTISTIKHQWDVNSIQCAMSLSYMKPLKHRGSSYTTTTAAACFSNSKY